MYNYTLIITTLVLIVINDGFTSVRLHLSTVKFNGVNGGGAGASLAGGVYNWPFGNSSDNPHCIKRSLG